MRRAASPGQVETSDAQLLSETTVETIKRLRTEYEVPGMALAAVAGPCKSTGRIEWGQEIFTSGRAKGDGKIYSRGSQLAAGFSRAWWQNPPGNGGLAPLAISHAYTQLASPNLTQRSVTGISKGKRDQTHPLSTL